jgi:hypothetical protein
MAEASLDSRGESRMCVARRILKDRDERSRRLRFQNECQEGELGTRTPVPSPGTETEKSKSKQKSFLNGRSQRVSSLNAIGGTWAGVCLNRDQRRTLINPYSSSCSEIVVVLIVVLDFYGPHRHELLVMMCHGNELEFLLTP